ncbi:MAG TPA: universal stress protein [Candidatus Binatia bacterium]|jgi:nucleotide-binding universal stress UspA family protein|nr:universal stress protein [Candidatus Binatia bacterium]
MIKNILVPLDGSEHSKAALDYSLWMAEKFSGTLFGQHVIDTVSIEGTFFHDISGSLGFEPYLDFSTRMREVLEERGKAILDDFSQRCKQKGIRHDTFLDMGIIPNEICERSKMADLVVLGHRGVNERFSTGLLGGTTESVTRKAPRPVFVSTSKFKPIERPLLAYDGSQRASAAMESAAEFCSRLRLPLTVLHVPKDERLGEKILHEARSYLNSYEFEVRYETSRGYPEQKIVDYLLNFNYDLVFIGAYGHRRIIEMVLGSTTEYVLRKSPCPVFLNR